MENATKGFPNQDDAVKKVLASTPEVQKAFGLSAMSTHQYANNKFTHQAKRLDRFGYKKDTEKKPVYGTYELLKDNAGRSWSFPKGVNVYKHSETLTIVRDDKEVDGVKYEYLKVVKPDEFNTDDKGVFNG